MNTSAYRDRYKISTVLYTCVLLRILASPARWRYLEEMLGINASQLSEIFWELVDHFLDAFDHLLSNDIQASYLVPDFKLWRQIYTVIAFAYRTASGLFTVRYLKSLDQVIALSREILKTATSAKMSSIIKLSIHMTA